MSRVWDLPPHLLCQKHLVAEHRELHGVWAVIDRGLKGYSHHPETKRWRGKLPALKARHDTLVAEAKRRGYPMGTNHKTPLEPREGQTTQDEYVDTIEDQKANLRAKGCWCEV